MKEIENVIKNKSIFRNRNFMILFIGKLVSQLGDVIYNIAIGWFILTITKSAIQMSIYMALGTIVYLVVCPLGGVICDRVDRKHIIIWMDIIRGIVVMIVGGLLYLNIQSIWLFYFATIILSISGALFAPASNALIPEIVKENQLSKANSVGLSIQSLANLAGLIAGGILYAVIGIKGIFVINAVSYIACGILEMFIVLPKTNKSKLNLKDLTLKTFYYESKESYVFLKKQKGLFMTMWLSAIISLIVVPLFAVFVPYIFNQIVKTSASEYSYVEAAMAVGFIIGAIIVSNTRQRDKIFKIIKKTLIALTILIVSMGMFTQLYMMRKISGMALLISFIIIFLFLGIALSFLAINFNVKFQKSIPNEMLGRVTALVNTLAICSMPLGMIIGGVTADLFPINVSVFIISFLVVVIAIIAVRQKEIRKM